MTEHAAHTQRRHRSGWVLLALLFVSLLSLAVSLLSGSYPISGHDYLAMLNGNIDTPAYFVLHDLRWPRAVTAFTTGGLLALAGVLMQVLLRNPLADPYVLGISGGASVFALFGMWLGLSATIVHLGAFAGALLSMLLVFALAHGRGVWTATRMLLTGVVLASGWGALISFVLSIAPEQNLRGMLFWLMGDLSYAQLSWPSLLILLGGLGLALLWARALNILAIGSVQAKTLGVPVERLHWQIFLLASLLTAVAVMQAGSIGFIGLIIPHLLRLAGLHDHRWLLPAAVAAGGSLLLLADTLTRSLYTQVSLPVGVFTALVGVPIFLYLMQRHESQRL
jgi:iron complex transport system permease protein